METLSGILAISLGISIYKNYRSDEEGIDFAPFMGAYMLVVGGVCLFVFGLINSTIK